MRVACAARIFFQLEYKAHDRANFFEMQKVFLCQEQKVVNFASFSAYSRQKLLKHG
jgi:hypothetical protein